MADAQVAAWLRHAGLSRFSPRFAAALVSAPIFLQLSAADLDALGVDLPADRKRLADLIADLRRAAPARPRPRPERRLSRANSLSAAAMRRDPPPARARVTVCVRKRPLSRKETAAGDRDVVSVQPDAAALCVHELREKVDLTKYVDTHPFAFDRVFAEHAPNAAVYDGTARPLVDTLFAGGRATCFAYGQTGAGKTFTMAGDGPENPGLYTLAVRDVFNRIRRTESELWHKAEAEGLEDFEPPDPVQVWISFFEIYASKLHDLLNRSAKLECREDSNSEVQIVGLSHRLCEVEEDVLAYIEEGSAARSTGVTGANDDSSRSHAVFQIELRHPPAATVQADASTTMRENLLRNTRSRTAAAIEAKRGAEIGRLCFIDLAGSERGSDTASSTRQTRLEGAEINKSLLALKECIRAMDQRKDHTPFRGSKLTQVLKASFTGKNCSTVMIANISPASSNVEHTLNTLRYSDRVKEIKKDRVASASPTVLEAPGNKPLGSRRATFSHGIGLRAGRSTLGTTPLRTTQRQASFDVDRSEEGKGFPEPPALERKPSKTQNILTQPDKPLENSEGSRSILRTNSRGRKTLLRSRSRDAEKRSQDSSPEALEEQKATKKARETRLARRCTSRTPSLIPSRASLGSVGLSRSDLQLPMKAKEDKVLGGTSTTVKASPLSNLSQPSGMENRPPSEGLSRNQTVSVDIPESQASVAPIPTAAQTVSVAIESRRVQVEVDEAGSNESEQRATDLSQEQNTAAVEPDKEALKSRTQRRRATKAGNAAESAMKYYMTNNKDELPEEDLLFPSSDNLVDEATAAVQQRLCAASIAETDLEPVRGPIKTRSQAAAAAVKAHSVRNTAEAGTSPPTSSDDSLTPSFSTDTTKTTSSGQPEALKKVIRFHHVQIEELMRLTESDVALVNAAEKGDMDADEYALKLKLNLSQKMDIVRTLQSKLELLE